MAQELVETHWSYILTLPIQGAKSIAAGIGDAALPLVGAYGSIIDLENNKMYSIAGALRIRWEPPVDNKSVVLRFVPLKGIKSSPVVTHWTLDIADHIGGHWLIDLEPQDTMGDFKHFLRNSKRTKEPKLTAGPEDIDCRHYVDGVVSPAKASIIAQKQSSSSPMTTSTTQGEFPLCVVTPVGASTGSKATPRGKIGILSSQDEAEKQQGYGYRFTTPAASAARIEVEFKGQSSVRLQQQRHVVQLHSLPPGPVWVRLYDNNNRLLNAYEFEAVSEDTFKSRIRMKTSQSPIKVAELDGLLACEADWPFPAPMSGKVRTLLAYEERDTEADQKSTEAVAMEDAVPSSAEEQRTPLPTPKPRDKPEVIVDEEMQAHCKSPYGELSPLYEELLPTRSDDGHDPFSKGLGDSVS